MVSPCSTKKKNDEFAESDVNAKPVPGEKPLLGRRIYFDLKNRLVASKLETQIKELGGVVEVFLVKEVTHVVTDRESWHANKTDSPVSRVTRTSYSNASPNLETSVRPKTRADAMLERARCQTTSVVNDDPLDDARRWGIPVWSVEKVLSWLDQIRAQVLELKKKVKVFPLKQPYIKFEAFDRTTRPVFKEIRAWPTANLRGSLGDPAFACESPRRTMTRKTRVGHGRKDDTSRPGYCEVCRAEYGRLDVHVRTEAHRKFASDNSNFIALDKLIDDGADIESFLKLHGSEDKGLSEKMCDQDVEYSPPSRRKRSTMKNNGSSEREKLRSLSLSLNNEMGGHRLRSRTHVDYTLNSPTEEEFPEKVDSPLKESKDLRRSSTRLSLKASERERQEAEQVTWESGRPKRSCIVNRKRISADERLVADNRTYYKVEVMLNKLRSSGLTARDHELLKNQRTPTPEKKSKENNVDKGLIVKFRKIRNSELTFLNNEAENFLFPKKEESSDEDPDADGPNTTASSGRHDSSLLLSSEPDENDKTDHSVRKRTPKVKVEDESAMDGFSHEIVVKKRGRPVGSGKVAKVKVEEEADNSLSRSDKALSKEVVTDDGSMDSTCSETKKKRRRTHAEAFIMDNQKYYKFETPGSRLRYQGSFLPPVTATSKTTPLKNNGESLVKNELPEDGSQSNIDFSKITYSFEVVPGIEPWYQSFRRQDVGEVFYWQIPEIDLERPLFLPYQLPPLPPLDPRICKAAYKQRKKSVDSKATTSGDQEQSLSSADDTSAVNNTDNTISEASQSEAGEKEEEETPKLSKSKKRRYTVPSRNPRKSPRQHASTLAILSSLVQHRKKRSDANKSRGSSDLNDSKKKLPVIKEEERKEDVDLEAVEKMFDSEDDRLLELEVTDPEDGVDLKSHPDVIEALETYQEMKEIEAQPKTPKKLSNGASARKPGRKKKTNKTGWPNKNRRHFLRNKEANSTKEEEETRSVDSGEKTDCGTSVRSVDLDKWENAEKELVAKINNCEFQPYVRVQKLENEVVVRHKRLGSDESSQNTETRAKRTQTSPKSPRALRRPRGRWYKER